MLEVGPLARGLRKSAVPAFCASHLRVRGFIPRPARNPRLIHRPSTARLESHCCSTHHDGPKGSTAAKTGVSSLALVSVFFHRAKLWEICTYKRIGSNPCRRGSYARTRRGTPGPWLRNIWPSIAKCLGIRRHSSAEPNHRRMCTYKKKGGGHASASIPRSRLLSTNDRIVLSIPEPRRNCLRMCTCEIAKISCLESTLAKKWGWGVPLQTGPFHHDS
jgi:hypothetical protein